MLMNKPVYLGISILDTRNIEIYEFLYDHIKPIYGEKAKSCYMNRDSFVFYIKTKYIYLDIAKNLEAKFDEKIKNKKEVALMKNELGDKIMAEFSCLPDDGDENIEAKGAQNCVINKNLNMKILSMFNMSRKYLKLKKNKATKKNLM